MKKGIIVKAYSGHYYVYDGACIRDCKLRGKFRRHGARVLVGDEVMACFDDTQGGVIEEILPRRTELLRPPVANVDLALIVFAATKPEADLFLLDRLLVLVEHSGIEPVICCNKIDLCDDLTQPFWVEVLLSAGYSVIVTSAKKGIGINKVRETLKNRVSVMAGSSGVGKSSLLNAVQPGFMLKTGEISEKINRGRHVTRHVEFLKLETGGFMADAPGFSSLSLPDDLRREDLQEYFPEIKKHSSICRFNGCLHDQEPDCAVKAAVESGEVSQHRYNHYIGFLKEVIMNERRY